MNKSKLSELMTVEAMRALLRDRMPLTQIPKDFYCVLQLPALLAGMRGPKEGVDWKGMAKIGFSHVVNLADDIYSEYDPAPLKILYSANLEDLYSGGPPRDPERERRLISEAVETIVPKLKNGEGVVIHCMGGRGRTGTVMGCVLKRLGYLPEEIVRYLNDLHIARGKEGWPESEWQSTLIREFQ